MKKISLPSGHVIVYELVPVELSNKAELNVLKTNCQELAKMYEQGKTYILNGPNDYIILEGSKVFFN